MPLGNIIECTIAIAFFIYIVLYNRKRTPKNVIGFKRKFNPFRRYKKIHPKRKTYDDICWNEVLKAEGHKRKKRF